MSVSYFLNVLVMWKNDIFLISMQRSESVADPMGKTEAQVQSCKKNYLGQN